MTEEKTKTKKSSEGSMGRKLKPEYYRSFRLQKPIKIAVRPRIIGGFRLFSATMSVLRRNWKTFLGISLIYATLNLLLVQGLVGFDTTAAKQAIQNIWDGGIGGIGSGFTVITSLFGGNGVVGDVASVYQFILFIVASLALIWTFRHVVGGEKVRIRDGFYKGMYPLIPFLFVYLVLALQLLPLALGTYLYNSAGPGFAIVNGIEAIIWVLVLGLLTILTLYMLSSSVFALYIVSLPGATPVASLRTARKLVYGRRLLIIRRFLVLPLILLVGGALLLVPAILLSPIAAVIVFFALNLLLLPIVHGYMYSLYQELIREIA